MMTMTMSNHSQQPRFVQFYLNKSGPGDGWEGVGNICLVRSSVQFDFHHCRLPVMTATSCKILLKQRNDNLYGLEQICGNGHVGDLLTAVQSNSFRCCQRHLKANANYTTLKRGLTSCSWVNAFSVALKIHTIHMERNVDCKQNCVCSWRKLRALSNLCLMDQPLLQKSSRKKSNLCCSAPVNNVLPLCHKIINKHESAHSHGPLSQGSHIIFLGKSQNLFKYLYGFWILFWQNVTGSS